MTRSGVKTRPAYLKNTLLVASPVRQRQDWAHSTDLPPNEHMSPPNLYRCQDWAMSDCRKPEPAKTDGCPSFWNTK